jgi:hypothetical protein
VASERGCLCLGCVAGAGEQKRRRESFRPFGVLLIPQGLILERTCWSRASLLLFSVAPFICQQDFIDICSLLRSEKCLQVTRLQLVREIYLTRPDPRALALRRRPRARTTLQPVGPGLTSQD